MRQLGALVAILLIFTACSSDDEQGEDQEVTTTTATPDEAPTTSSPPGDASRTTTAAPATGTAAPTTDSAPAEATTTPPAQTQAAPPPASCSAADMASDLGYDEPLEIFVCESGWAYATYLGGTGDTEFIAQRLDGVWVRVMGMGSPTCQDELLDMGAPLSVVVDVLPCDVMYPPDEPSADDPPRSDCTVQSEIFGTTYADLVQVGCDEARALWAAAATGHPGSWDELVPAFGGWECTVVPYEPYPPIAGACFGPGGDGEQFFVLNL